MARSRKGKKDLNNSKKDLLGEDGIDEEVKYNDDDDDDDDDGDEGETNLGYVQDASDIIKSRSKEDVKTLRRNLSKSKGDGQKKKVTKKKTFDEGENVSVRIENKLFENKNKEELNAPTNRRKKSRHRNIPKNHDQEHIEMTQMSEHQSGVDNETEIGAGQVEEFLSTIARDNEKDDTSGKSTRKRNSKSTMRKKRNTQDSAPISTGEITQSAIQVAPPITEQKSRTMEPRRVFGVFVHYSDCLKLNLHVMHPLVKVSIINLETGELVAKSHRRQKVSSYYETEHVKHVVPLMTQPFEFRHRKSIVPRWEELLLFNDEFDYFVSFGANLGVFFEILDFVSMSAVVNNQVGMSSGQGGWHHVAWAFLKPVPSKNYSNVGKRVRLQMYKPGNSPNFNATLSFSRSISAPVGEPETKNITNVWYWWNKCQHIAYPSSLYVTVEPISPPMIQNVQPALRSMTAAQPEYGSTNLLDRSINKDAYEGDSPVRGESLGNENLPRVVLWARLPGQTCRIPEKEIFQLDTLTKGARCIIFSSDGRYLAASCPVSKEHSVILIYGVTNGTLELTLDGHKGPIYALDWHRDDYLLSASGDTTAKIWAPKSKSAQMERATLEHPCYVYAAKFHPNSINLLATAGYDNVIRIWMKEYIDDDDDNQIDESLDKRKHKKKNGLNYVIKHELVSHKSYVNCLVFDIDGQLLFSGDNEGAIRVWEPHMQESPTGTPSSIPTSKQMFNNTLWYLKKKLEFKEIIKNPITSMHVHPGGRRLLVQCRSMMSPNSLFMIDLKLNLIMQTFSGSQSFRKNTGGCISPCGTYVFAGSQGKIN